MDHNDAFVPEEKKAKNKNRQMIIIFSLAAVLLLVGDLFVMTHLVSIFMVYILILVTVLLMICAYVIINAVLREIDDGKKYAEEQYEAMAKAEKATYLLTKKVIDQFSGMQDAVKDPLQEVLNAQKGVAKVTINRSKEHAEAMMNSNDRILEQIITIEEKFDSMQVNYFEKNQEELQNVMQTLDAKEQEMISGLGDIRNEMLEISNIIQGLQAQSASIQQSIAEQQDMLTGQQDMLTKQQSILTEQRDMTFGKSFIPQDEQADYMEEASMESDEPAFADFDTLSSEEMNLGEPAPDEGLDLGGLTLEGDTSFEEEPLSEGLDLEGLSIGEGLNLGESVLDEGPDLGGLTLEGDMSLEEEPLNENLDLGGLSIDEGLDFGGLSIDEDLNLGESVLDEGLNLGESVLDEGLNLGESVLDEGLDFGGLSLEGNMNLEEEPLSEGLDLGGLSIDEGLNPEESILDEGLGLEETSLGDMMDLGESSVNEEIEIRASELSGEMGLNDPVLEDDIGLGDITLDKGFGADEPEAEPEPVIPAAPDLSNPNKMMTPEEIEALLANM